MLPMAVCLTPMHSVGVKIATWLDRATSAERTRVVARARSASAAAFVGPIVVNMTIDGAVLLGRWCSKHEHINRQRSTENKGGGENTKRRCTKYTTEKYVLAQCHGQTAHTTHTSN